MKNLLMVSDFFIEGGLETHISTFIKHLKIRIPHLNIHFLSGFKKKPYFDDIDLYSYCHDYQSTYNQTFYSRILSIRNYAKSLVDTYSFDIIHSHPFASIFSSFMLTQEYNIPLAITLHGKISCNIPDRFLSRFFFKKILPNSIVFSVNPSVKPTDNTYYLPNPIDENFWNDKENCDNEDFLLIVSRLDADKFKGIDKVLNKLSELNHPIVVAGEGQYKSFLEKKYPNVEFKGGLSQIQLKDLMKKAYVVCGMGRVVLESLFLRKPTLIMNYEGQLDILDSEEKIDKYSLFNFNGSNIENSISINKSFLEKVQFLQSNKIKFKALDRFKASKVVELYLSIIEDTLRKKRNPISSIPKEDIEELFLYLEDMDKKERDLIYARSLLEQKAEEIKQKEESLNQKIRKMLAEIKKKEGELKEKKDQLDEKDRQIAELQKQKEDYYQSLLEIQNSRSWKLISRYYKFKTYLKSLLQYKEKKKIKKEITSYIKESELNSYIIFHPVLDWNIPLHQRPQHIAVQLAKQGFTYFYCTINHYDRIDGIQKVSERCYVTNYFNYLDNIKSDYKRIYHIHAADSNIDIPFLEKRLKRGDLILYEYMDEIHEDLIGRVAKKVTRRHKWVLENENIMVVATSTKLFEEVKQYRKKNFILVTNGVDVNHFSKKFSREDIPSEIKDIVGQQPIIGYFGALAKWFDYELIEFLAKRNPNWTFLLIGWDYDGSLKQSGILAYSNVRVIGPIPYKELPRYAYWFDIATIPFKINDITLATSPIKLFEYFALSKPVVSVDLPEVRKYNQVLIARNFKEFEEKIQEALLLKEDESFIRDLYQVALENSWEKKALQIKNLILENLER